MNSAERAVATVDRLVPITERALSVAQEAPKFLLGEREAVIKALHDELTQTITFAQEQCIAALEHLTKDRIAALEHPTKERTAAFNDIRETLVEERRRR